MEKLEINNEILTLKREMKTGRVHLLRRLIAQVKKLENAKGTDEQRAKKKQKAERWMQQVKVLQKANLDSLARKVIVSEECWLKVISEPKSTLEERAQARLLNLKKVQDFVGGFRKEHPDWKSWVPQLVEMWDEKKARRLTYKPTGANATEIGVAGTGERPPKRQRREKKVETPSGQVDDTDNTEEEDDDDDDEEVTIDTGSSEDDRGDIVEQKPKAADPETKRPAAAKPKRLPEKVAQKRRTNLKAAAAVLPRERVAASGVAKEVPRMSTKVKGSVLVAAVDMSQLGGGQEDAQLRFAAAGDEPHSDDDNSTEATKEPVKKRDPFFCREGNDDNDDGDESGSGGERFHRDDEDDAQDSGRGRHRRGGGGGRFSRPPRGGSSFRGRGFDREGSFKGRGGFRGDSRGRGRGVGRGGFGRGRGSERGGFGRGRGSERGGFGRGGRGRVDEAGGGSKLPKRSHDAQRSSVGGGNESADGPVHPSWAAKQQQKVKLANLSAFQGKKISFD